MSALLCCLHLYKLRSPAFTDTITNQISSEINTEIATTTQIACTVVNPWSLVAADRNGTSKRVNLPAAATEEMKCHAVLQLNVVLLSC